MSGIRRPASLVAERAVRYLRERGRPADSVHLAARVLATKAPNEATARKVLATAFTGDPRLIYDRRRWRLVPPRPGAPELVAHPEVYADADADADAHVDAGAAEIPQRDRALVVLDGARPGPGLPFQLLTVSVLRVRGAHVVGACGGDAAEGPPGRHLRRAIRETLAGADVIAHDRPGALPAFERWLGERLETPVSLRRLAQLRLGLGADHDLDALVQQVGLRRRATPDPLEQAELLEACLAALRQPGESLRDLWRLTAAGAKPIDWSRLAFDRAFIDQAPRAPGTYRFFDADGALLYVGKSKNLARRLRSYFEEGRARPKRVQVLLDRLHRVEYEPWGSELEALLREAEQIRRRKPEHNVQRKQHPKAGRASRLRSILILEPAEPPAVLRAFLLHEGRLVARLSLGPRGGGLARIERALDQYFFYPNPGPQPTPGPDLDVELIARWLSANRDRAVAFDPTQLRSTQEIVERLRWFLDQGSPFDPQGDPIYPR